MTTDTTPPPRDDIAALRAELFSALRAVRSGALDIDRAKAVNALAGTLIDSARVEVQYLQALPDDAARSSFLDNEAGHRLPPGITGVTVHRLKG